VCSRQLCRGRAGSGRPGHSSGIRGLSHQLSPPSGGHHAGGQPWHLQRFGARPTTRRTVPAHLDVRGVRRPVGAPQRETYWGNVNPIGPRSVYDESKRFAEALTYAYRRQGLVDARAVRIFNTYGPRMAVDDGRVVPTFLAQALRGRPMTVAGDGEQTRTTPVHSTSEAGTSSRCSSWPRRCDWCATRSPRSSTPTHPRMFRGYAVPICLERRPSCAGGRRWLSMTVYAERRLAEPLRPLRPPRRPRRWSRRRPRRHGPRDVRPGPARADDHMTRPGATGRDEPLAEAAESPPWRWLSTSRRTPLT
jgi:hypothetical protein